MLRKFDNPLANCELKFEGDRALQFEGYASVFGNVDSVGDTITKGAFAETIDPDKRARMPLMLYGHSPGRVIGKWLWLKEDDTGLRVKGEFTPRHTDAANVYASMEHGAIDGLSIGFRIPPGGSAEREEGGRVITKVDLVEISVVSFPADEYARVDTLKSEIESIDSIRDAEQFLRDSAMFTRSMATAFISRVKRLVQSDSDCAKQNIIDVQSMINLHFERLIK